MLTAVTNIYVLSEDFGYFESVCYQEMALGTRVVRVRDDAGLLNARDKFVGFGAETGTRNKMNYRITARS